MPTAYVHIGLAKTGTTAIQRAAAKLQEPLEAAGIRFLRHGRTDEQNGHHCLAWALRSARQANGACSPDTLEEVRAELAGLAGTDTNVLVSSEELSLSAYRPLELAALRDLFAGYRLCVLVYVRDQVDFFNSFYVELIKSMLTAESVGECLDRLSQEERYHYADWLRPWRGVCDELIVRPYDRPAFVQHSVLDDFFARIGYAGAMPDHLGQSNPALSATEVAALQRVMRELQESGITPETVPPAWWRALRADVHAALRTADLSTSGKYWGIPPKVTQALHDKFRESNRAFFADFMGEPYTFSGADTAPPLNVATYQDVPAAVREALQRVVAAAREGVPRQRSA